MPFVSRNSLLGGSIVVVAAVAVAGGFAWSGIYNIGADDSHTRPVYAMLQLLRDRSIAARARSLQPPHNLADPVLIRQGAGNYDAMCVGCHLGPGMDATELSKGLYPSPPDLSKADIGDPSHHFWVVKHGIKASGMPAWGRSMSDEYIWNMVAFLKVLPTLDAERYRALVDSSGGHSHGGGETRPHGEAISDDRGNGPMASLPMVESRPNDHPSGTAPHQDKAAESQAAATGAPAYRHTAPKPAGDNVEHRHADGTVESHPIPSPAPVPADDGHDHQH